MHRLPGHVQTTSNLALGDGLLMERSHSLIAGGSIGA